MALDTKEKILRAAVKLFENNGFSGTSTMAIAKEANVSEMTIFRNFGNKENLFHEAVGEITKDGDFTLVQGAITGELSEDLSYLGVLIMDFFEKRRNLMLMMMFESIKQPEIMELLKDGPLNNNKILCEYLEQLKNAGKIREHVEVDKIVEIFTGAIFGYVLGLENFKKDSKDDGEKNRAEFLDVLVEQIVLSIEI